MADFADTEHNLAELIFHGVEELDPAALCDTEVLGAVHAWRERENIHEPGPEIFQLPLTRSFTITYQGKVEYYWPDEESNFEGESLIRQFLFHNGICSLADDTVRLYRVQYSLLAMDDTEYLLVCPYRTSDGNIAGIVVICVNKRLKQPTK